MMIPFTSIVFFGLVTCQLSKITAFNEVKNSGQHYTEEHTLRTRLGSPVGSLTSLTLVLIASQNSIPVRPAQVPRPRPSKPAQVPRPKPTKPAQHPKRTPIAAVPIIPRPSTPKIPVYTVSVPKAPRTLPVKAAPTLAAIAPRQSPVKAVPVVSQPIPRPVTKASAPSSTSLAPISIINPPEGTNVTVPSTMYCGVKFSNGSFACYSVGVPCTSRSNCTGLVDGTITYNQCIMECGPSPSK